MTIHTLKLMKQMHSAVMPRQKNEALPRLLDALDDAEVVTLVDAVVIRFQRSTQEVDRDTLEGVLDEAERGASGLQRRYQS